MACLAPAESPESAPLLYDPRRRSATLAAIGTDIGERARRNEGKDLLTSEVQG